MSLLNSPFVCPSPEGVAFMVDAFGDFSPAELRAMRETHFDVSEDRQQRVYDELADRLDAGGWACLDEVPVSLRADVLRHRERTADDWLVLWSAEEALLAEFGSFDSAALRELGDLASVRIADALDHFRWATVADVPRGRLADVAL
jgi:hypothetical protein